jgi:sugar lactone lactonase YvrE
MTARFFIALTFVVACAIPTASRAQQFPAVGSAIDVDVNGVITVVDRIACTLRQYSPDGSVLRTMGGAGWGNDQFDQPSGVWARNGIDVFVADYGNHRIQRFDKNLAFISSLFTRNDDKAESRFGYPSSLAVSRLGDLYVCDTENTRIVKFGSASAQAVSFGGYTAGAGRLEHPSVVVCGPSDMVFVLDGGSVKMFDAFGNYTGVLPLPEHQTILALAADDAGVAVLDSARLSLFDAALRPLPVIDQHELGSIRAIGLGPKKIHCLTDTGISAIDDPRRSEYLDNERKSR